MKLCWGLISQPIALWVRCLKSKYGCGNYKLLVVRKKQNQSAVWSAIVSVWEIFMEGVYRRIRNGKSTLAWTDIWVDLELPLLDYVERNHHLINLEARVSDFVTASGSWDIMK